MIYTYEQHKNLIRRHDNEQQRNRIEMKNMYNYPIPISILQQIHLTFKHIKDIHALSIVHIVNKRLTRL
jgi:hypothetical protein